jgi:uncharacterized damage-inducible protein DinB
VLTVLLLYVVSNGVHHASKKLKMMKQGIDSSAEASRVASQMSNMANPGRFIKIIANRERGRKCKALKVLLFLYNHMVFSLLAQASPL